MQHPDEGTIHAWLDGALSAEEAARIEAHVNECPQCAAAVAEARGFIAASSRILTALDNVPTGVVPAVARNATTRNWMYWRAAAAVLVIAIGTVVVRREQTGTSQTFATGETADTNPVPAFAPPIKVLGKRAVAAPSVAQSTPSGAGQTLQPQAALETRRESHIAAGVSGGPDAGRRSNESTPAAVGGGRASTPAASGQAPGAEISGNKSGETPLPITLRGTSTLQSVNGGVALDAVGIGASQPRALSARRAIGVNRIFYEIAPGDTVVLIESLPNQLDEVVTGTAVAATRATTPTATGATTTTARPNPQTPQSAPPVSADAQTSQPATGATAKQAAPTNLNTIVWTDPATGHTMELSGHHTRTELEAIRQSIERARAAEAVKKKAP